MCGIGLLFCILLCVPDASVHVSSYGSGLHKYNRSGYVKNTYKHTKEVRKYNRRRDKRLSRWGIDTDVGIDVG